jgi:hypothetical protein
MFEISLRMGAQVNFTQCRSSSPFVLLEKIYAPRLVLIVSK